ncbi:hypothetical protein LIER_41274 [Lithospermum erythrorhizon]|uniref:Uncharacterized protein n=1 Tax=Lithospermum erythrorhizon TaxID=34254 RepID=A0AAV3RA05_LITER
MEWAYMFLTLALFLVHRLLLALDGYDLAPKAFAQVESLGKCFSSAALVVILAPRLTSSCNRILSQLRSATSAEIARLFVLEQGYP